MADSFLNIKVTSKGKLFKVSGQNISIGKELEKRLGDKGLLKKDVQEVAEMLRDKIEANILNAKTFRGGNVAGLKKSTRDRKGHSRPLYETGKLAKGVILKKGGDGVSVTMSSLRYAKPKKKTNRKTKGNKSSMPTVLQVAEYLNAGNSQMKARPFFGYTKKDITTFAKLVIRDRLFSKSPRRAA